MSIFNCTCNNAIHGVFTNSYLISTPCCRRAPHACPLSPCATHLPNRRPPACMWLWTVCHTPGLAAPRHHAPNAVTATGPCPSTRASTTPAVAGPWRGSSTALPTLIHGPTGEEQWGGSDTKKHRQTERRGYKEERER